MQQLRNVLFAASFLLLVTACGSGSKDDKGKLAEKKAELIKLQNEQKTLSDKVAKLQEEIGKLDSTTLDVKTKLVALTPVGTDTFTHFIDLQGKIDAQNVAYVAPNGQGGQVKQIFVKQGDRVRKGQAILKLDDAIQRQQVVAAQQQLAGLESSLKLAQSVYERQKNLWAQNIGTEVQVLQAKTQAEGAASQLSSAQANVRLAQEQVNLTVVTAGISGTIDQMNVKVGEFFSPQSAATPGAGISIVNTGDLKVLVQVPENYQDRISLGSTLNVTLPEANNKTISTKVSVVGKLIDPNTRSFYVEAKIPADKAFRPNQIAMVRIQDYTKPDAITIPVNTLQNDEKGKFVLVAVTENGKLIARKKAIGIGELYGDKLEVKTGLQAGDQVITEGFQGLYDGQPITTTVK